MQLFDPQILDGIAELGRWSVKGFWLPLLVWTCLAIPVYMVARSTGPRAVHVRYWALVAILFALPLGVAAAAFNLFDPWSTGRMAIVTMPASFTVAAPASTGGLLHWTIWHTAGAALILTWLGVVWRGCFLTVGYRELRRLNRATRETPQWIEDETTRLCCQLRLPRRAAVVISSTPSPFSVGWFRPSIVLPHDLIQSPEDLRFALTHELIHIRRNDYALHIAEQIIGALFYCHPLVTLIRHEVADLREITCDADVLSQTGRRSAYARLLYRYSIFDAGERMFAVGIIERENQLHKRIRAMQSFLSDHKMNPSKKRAFATFATVLGLAIVAVACSDSLTTSSDPSDRVAADDSYTVVDEMPELIGGLQSIQKELRYPEIARKAGIEGRVVVQFVVDEQGKVVDPEVIEGVGSGLDEAALAAVRTARFEPGQQGGEPVKVEISLPVTFRLGVDQNGAPERDD